MGRFGVGQAVRRSEDPRFLTGRGRYTDDIDLPRQVYAVFIRSPHAHARVKAIDTAQASAAPGVHGVFTAADAAADGLGPLPCLSPAQNHDGSMMVDAPRPLLAAERVRHVGDTVAMVVAETIAAAQDAAELVAVDYEPLAAVADTAAAVEPGAPLVRDQAPRNVCFDWRTGDRAATERAFAAAHHVTTIDLVNNRVVANPIEPRAALGDYDRAADRYTLHTSSQGSHKLIDVLSEHVLKVPAEKLRVVTADVGGSFGIKIFTYPEHALVLWASRKVGRPVKWTATRSDGFITDTHGRDHVSHAELALDAEGRFLGLRVATIANLGAYASAFGPFIPTDCCCPMLTGVYAIGAVHAKVEAVFTHTVPVDAYRGAGRPEAAYLVERLVAVAASELGVAPDELRRRNYVPSSAMPYRTALGLTFDHGEFARNMDDAMARAGWAGMPARRAEARARGKLRGIGMANYIERCAGPGGEDAEIRFEPDGAVVVLAGTQSNGQGHETAFAQIVADRLGVPFESVRVRQGDSDAIPFGAGTGGSRSLALGGSAVGVAAAGVIEQGKRLAAHTLETAIVDIEFADGVFTVAGTDRAVAIVDVAKASFDPATAAAARVRPGLDEAGHADAKAETFPNGCHVCEVEIDEETGAVAVVAYTVADDFGDIVNPLLVAGQVHGGVVQGIGQAVLERCAYEAESGQLLSASFMDYCLPRADDTPAIAFTTNATPCDANALGDKGCGEAGAIGAPPAVINAIVDALAAFGVRHIDMPATPERVWRAIQRAKAGSPSG